MGSDHILPENPEFAKLLFDTYHEAGCDRFILIQPGTKEPLRDPETGSWAVVDVATAFQHWLGGGNVAIVPTWYNMTVLDFDPLPGCRIKVSHVLEVLASAGITKTPIVLSPGQKHEGGIHVHLKDPGPEWDIKLPIFDIPNLNHVDVRRGNYILLPPSTINGKKYQWYDDGKELWALGTTALAEVPRAWLVPAKAEDELEIPTAGVDLAAAIEKLAQKCRSGDAEFVKQALTGSWPEKQTDGIDRSGAEYRLARICEEAGLTPQETAAVVRVSAVHQAKFGNRQDERERLKAVVEAAFQDRTEQQSPPRVSVGKIWSADELARADLPEPSWLLPGLLPAQGLTVLAGRPKVGKSWLALDIALSLAASKQVLGMRPPAEAPTLYISLEDNPRRLKNRLEMARLPAPRDGLLTTSFPNMPAALEELDKLIPRYGLKLIAVDTWARFRPARRGKSSDIYAQDYQEISAFKQLLDTHGIAGLLVHHLNQAKDTEHWTDRVLGTTGLIGGPDTLLALTRAPQGAVLRAIGRDVPETELAVEFKDYRWHVLGAAEQVHMSEARKQVLEALRLLNGATAQEVADYTGKPPSTVRRLLAHLHRDGLVVKVKGRYYPVEGLIIKHQGKVVEVNFAQLNPTRGEDNTNDDN
ncbi:AAA family ATPase [Thermanaeromonas sp. C210]|uniref:AAA family ATPase n=1 Tax=Thermanaeromonas sp. C210 TaxID=2731925 RepID=UPI00155C3E23|nr:AAA family ATPase [Thermanaeromonas sp. C210]GFN22166.1 hypothetical protein TAMC210_04820 [Thermanaeromonas sp. C210]